MRLTKRKLSLALFTFAVALVAILYINFQLQSDSQPIVSDKELQLVLQSNPPRKLIMSDAIGFFQSRLRERNGEDVLAQNHLVGSYLLRFKAYGKNENLKMAKKYLSELLERYPTKATLHAKLSAICLAEHEFENAVKSARQAIEYSEDKRNSGLFLRLFDALFAYGQYDEAQRLLKTNWLNSKSFGFLVRKARLEDKLGNLEQAKVNMRKALKEAKAYAQSPVVIAWCLVSLGHFEHHGGNPEKAVENYLAALEQLPGYPAAIEGIASISYAADRNLRAARLLYEKAIRNGGELDLYAKLIKIEKRLGNKRKSDEYRAIFITKATQHPATERLFYRPLALLLAEHKETLSRALGYAKLDLENRPNSDSYDTLAWVLYRMGDLAGAYNASKKALAYEIPEPEVLYHGGMIAWELGEMSKAKSLLERALASSFELDPDVVEEIQQKLAST